LINSWWHNVIIRLHLLAMTKYSNIFSSLRGGVRSIVLRMSVCLSVCLSVHCHISNITHLNFTSSFLHVAHVAMSQSSTDSVVISYVSWFHTMGPMGRIRQIKHSKMFRRILPGGGTIWTSDNFSVWLSLSECSTGSKVCCLQLPCFWWVV